MNEFENFITSLPVEMMLVYVAGPVIMGGIGALIGGTRNRAGAGFILGTFLGPLGWLLILLFEADGRKCSKCFGVVHPQATRCRHCGTELLALPVRSARRVI